MPKQSGIYKLKGKLDGLSYYRQSGVDSQLVRRINSAMSDRVKTSDEFANTRRNNVEFGGAADVAKLLGAAVQPKFRPMFLNFSQSKLTKDILEMVKQSTGDWGQRAVTAANTEDMFAALSALAKIPFASNFGLVESVQGEDSGETTINVGGTADMADRLLSLGIDGITFKCLTYQLLTGKYSANLGKIAPGSLIFGSSNSSDLTLQSGIIFEANFEDVAVVPAGITPPPTMVAHNLAVIVALPYRTINSQKYILQEYCSFYAIEAEVHA